MFGDDSGIGRLEPSGSGFHLQQVGSRHIVAMLDDESRAEVHNVVFRDGPVVGDSRLSVMQADNDPKPTIRPTAHLRLA